MSLEDEIVLALRQITRAIDLRSRGLMQQHGLTAPQLATLQAISRLQPVHAGAVAREIHLGQPTVTGVLNRLERQGLVQRTRGQHDRRQVEVRLTDEGQRVLQAAPSLLEDAFRQRLSGLRPWERTQILATLQRIAEMMHAGPLEERADLSADAEQGSMALDLHEELCSTEADPSAPLAAFETDGNPASPTPAEPLSGG